MGRAKVIPGPEKLLPYQAKWVRDESRLKLAEKSRQIGWTWATAYSLVRRKALKEDRRLVLTINHEGDIPELTDAYFDRWLKTAVASIRRKKKT
jgi:phage FluMu gp28-like protein